MALPAWITMAVLSVAFAAGGYAAAMRSTSRDVNGLGRKYGRIIALLVRWSDTPEKREQLADIIDPK